MSSVIHPIKAIAPAFTGNLYISGSVAVALGAADTPLVIKPFVEKISRGTILDGTNGTITIEHQGQYLVIMGASFSADKNAVLHSDIDINGAHQASIEWEREVSAGGFVGDAGGIGLLDLNGGDVITNNIESSFLNTTVTFNHAHFVVTFLG